MPCDRIFALFLLIFVQNFEILFGITLPGGIRFGFGNFGNFANFGKNGFGLDFGDFGGKNGGKFEFDFDIVNKISKISDKVMKGQEVLEGIPNLCPPSLRNSRRLRIRDSVRFYIYNRRQRSGYPKEISNFNLKDSAGLNPKAPLKILVHGWANNYTTGFSSLLKEAYSSLNYDVNIILVDWSQLSRQDDYGFSVQNTKFVGERLADIVTSILTLGLSKPWKVHMIGFSLGAHVAGFAGKILSFRKHGKIGRITGLDPANPCYLNVGPRDRLSSTDAQFVDVIHSNAYENGIGPNIGTADFYPNGGRHQPGCGLLHWACHHRRAHHYFAESILSSRGFRATKCQNWSTFSSGGCYGQMDTQMGEFVSHRAYGNYYLWTNSYSPYARG